MNIFQLNLCLILIGMWFISIQGLECGLNRGQDYDEFRKISYACIHQNDTKNLTDSDSDSESDETVYKTTTSNYGGSLLGRSNRKQRDINSAYNPCVVQCVFQELKLTDDRGYPDHERVVDALLKSARGRELRDFLQDSTDECFQVMEQGEKIDFCEYSAQLVNCLADRGRTNCADFPNGNLPFQY